MSDQPRVTWVPGALVPWDAPQTLNQQPRRPGGGSAPSGNPMFAPSGQRVVVFDPWRFVQLRGDKTLPLADSVSTLILNQNDIPRNYLSIRNASPAATPNIFISFGADASAINVFRLVQNTIIAWDTGVPQDDIYVFADAAGGVVSWNYSTLPFQ